jgi:hypothetical protein
MEDNHTTRLNGTELRNFFSELFPHGFAGADVVQEIAPEGWKNSRLFACFHPSPEQVLAECVFRHRMFQELRARRRKNALEEPESAAVPEPTIEEILADWEERPVNVTDEVTAIVGACLWDVFADNHNVVAADGRAVDIGSFRGASAFLDEYLTDSDTHWDGGDEFRFYMGSAWISGRANLMPVYRMIFRRLNFLGADWEYAFPQLHLLDLSPLRQAVEIPEESYSPSEAFAKSEEERQQQIEFEQARAELEEATNQARREAMEKPPPATVRAYLEVYGRNPTGWPPL